MTQDTWAGHDVLAALRQATVTLRAHVDEVNALNVFPVPDGDTGSNMVATLQAAVAQASSLPADSSVASVSRAASEGALMGARGNSGVILSQLLGGMSAALEGVDRVGGADLAVALQRGCEASYAAVARPVEGTLLTVARDAARAAARASSDSGGRLHAVLRASTEEAAASVARTPTLLPVLRDAGVVDAGGRGLELILRGTLAFASDEPPPVFAAAADVHLPAVEIADEEGFGYETVYVVTPDDGRPLDAIAIRDHLERIGESVLVAGDERAVKVHVHNERPDEVIAYGLSLGTLSRISVENLDLQALARRQAEHMSGPVPDGEAQTAPAATASAAPALPADVYQPSVRSGPAVVAVAGGEGLARLFETIGASAVVQAQKGVNVSAGELAEAIHGTGADEVIVLPNNANVRLAARQAAQLCADQQVVVVPTRNAAEGIAAVLALDESADLAANARRMHSAGRAVQTLQVASAVRDARIGTRRVARGQHIVLSGDQEVLAADDDRLAAVVDGIRRLEPGFELITLYHGEGTDAAEANELRDRLARELADVEVEVVEGGQHHYSYLIAAE